MAEYMNAMQDDMSNLNGMGVKSSGTQNRHCNWYTNKCKRRWIQKDLISSNAMSGIAAPWRRVFIGSTWSSQPKHGKDIAERRNSHNVVRFENLFLEK
jgi:hypothetical protein